MQRPTNLLAPILIYFLFISCDPSHSIEETPLFTIYEKSRIATDGGFTRGVAWADLTGDGAPELYTSNSVGQWNAMYANDGHGGMHKIRVGKQFSELIMHGGTSEGVSWVDYDNDGDLDLYICSRGKEPNQLFQNDSSKRFVMRNDHALTRDTLSTSMACWADYDLDGDLDVLLIGYRHNGNMFFENVGAGEFRALPEHVLSEGDGTARTCACGDANNDGLAEIFVGNAQRPNLYYRNLGRLQFEKDTLGAAVEDLGYAYGSSWADYDDDGDLDLFIANFDKENLLLSNDGSGKLTPATAGTFTTETGGASKGHAWGDYDNDGDLDIYIGNGTYGPEMANFLYLSDGKGSFERYLEGEFLTHADTTAGVAHADYDRDGDLDLFVANWGSYDQINRFYINQTVNKNWIAFRLRGTQSNTFGIGTHLILYTGEKEIHRWMYPITGYGSQNDYELHFGLGDEENIDSMVVIWPSGVHNKHFKLKVNQFVKLTEE